LAANCKPFNDLLRQLPPGAQGLGSFFSFAGLLQYAFIKRADPKTFAENRLR
jgi:hypothetical protein